MRNLYVLLIFFAVSLFASCSVSSVYYVDAVDGNDGNDGKSMDSPIKSLEALRKIAVKPGDRILLKRGSTFWGEWEISVRGIKGKPVIFDAYGEGNLPKIVGGDNSLYAVRILNSDYVTLQNMEIVNTGKLPLPKRTGLMLECSDYGVSYNIRINNVTIRDVNGSLVKDEGGGSGIYVVNRGDSILSCFDSLIIENCHIINCMRNAMIWSGYYDRRNWFPNKHTIIRNNLIEEVPGDGIVPIGCDSTLIEYNIMKDSPDILPMSEAAAGIWPWSCDNTIIQFNEVSGHKAPWDGQGFDADYNCRNTLIQYNYSHDNYGGLVLICNNGYADGYSCGNVGSIVRYNVSVGDGIRPKETRQGMFSPAIHIAGPVRNTLIERNIIHLNHKLMPETDSSMVVSDSWGGYADSTVFRNNLFYSDDASVFRMNASSRNIWESNYYIGKYDSIPEQIIKEDIADLYKTYILEEDMKGYNSFIKYMQPLNLKGREGYTVDQYKINQFWKQLKTK